VKKKPPYTPGYNLVAVVEAVGSDATRSRPGDRVADLTTIGAYAGYVPARGAAGAAAGRDVDALRMILSAVMPYQMLHRVAKVRAAEPADPRGGRRGGHGDAATGAGWGIAAFGTDIPVKHDLIRSRRATPIAADAHEDVLRDTLGEVLDIIFDPLGGDSLSRSLHALKPGGMMVAFDFQNEVLGRGGSIPVDFVKLKLWDWLPNGHATAFYSIGAMRRKHPEWFREDLERLLAMLAEGRIAPVVAEVLALEEVRSAHERVEAETSRASWLCACPALEQQPCLPVPEVERRDRRPHRTRRRATALRCSPG
jgi:NADPH:quinone reductase-like Zn-dependent oxidoreductase